MNQDTKALTKQDKLPVVNAYGKLIKFAKGIMRSEDEAKQFCQNLFIIAEKNPKIFKCSENSILATMLASATTKLKVNTPEQVAYAIPYGNELQFQASYQGLITLAKRTGKLDAIYAEIILPHEESEFLVEDGKQKMKHIIDMTANRSLFELGEFKDGKAVKGKEPGYKGVYAVAWERGSTHPTIVFMTPQDVAHVRASGSKTDNVWLSHPSDMIKKSAIKKLTKFLSKDDFSELATAAHYDSIFQAGKARADERSGEIIEVAQSVDEVKADDKEKKSNIAKAKAALKQREEKEENDGPTEEELGY